MNHILIGILLVVYIAIILTASSGSGASRVRRTSSSVAKGISLTANEASLLAEINKLLNAPITAATAAQLEKLVDQLAKLPPSAGTALLTSKLAIFASKVPNASAASKKLNTIAAKIEQALAKTPVEADLIATVNKLASLPPSPATAAQLDAIATKLATVPPSATTAAISAKIATIATELATVVPVEQVKAIIAKLDTVAAVQTAVKGQQEGTFMASYATSVKADYGLGSTAVTASAGSVAIKGGKLVLGTGAGNYVRYAAAGNADFTQTATIRFRLTPNYTTSFAGNTVFVNIGTVGSDAANAIWLFHAAADKTIRLRIKDSSNANIFPDASLGVWTHVQYKEYIFELNIDITTGATRLFIDGIQQGSTLTGTGTRTATAPTLQIGDWIVGGGNLSDFSMRDLIIYNTVASAAEGVPCLYGPWIASNVCLPAVGKKLSDKRSVYLIDEGGHIKMVADNGEARYYVGKIDQFDPTKWATYTNAGTNYKLRMCKPTCTKGCDESGNCPTAAQTPKAGEYTVLPQTDYAPGYTKNLSGTVEQCQDECNKIDNCLGFARVNNDCWFKDKKSATKVVAPTVTYYQRKTVPAGACVDTPANTTSPTRTYQKLDNTDYGGQGDLKDIDGDVVTCQKECDKTPNCKGFVRWDTRNHCWLKSNQVKTPGYNKDLIYYYTGTAPSAAASAPASKANTGRYVTLGAPKVQCLNIAEVQVFSTDGKTNIALNKPVTQSSMYGAQDFPTKNLVDGNLNNFAHTSCYDQGWMQIDLGSDLPITKIVVYNRVDCCQDRTNGVLIRIHDSKKSEIYVSDPINYANETGNAAYVVQPPSKKIAYFAYQDLSEKVPFNYNWRCHPGFDYPVSLNENNDVQCMSANAHDCIPGCDKNLQAPPKPLKVLACGEHHKKEWGNTGYDYDPGHWCNTTLPSLKAKVKNYDKCMSSLECASPDAYCRIGDKRCLTDAECAQANTTDKTNRDCTRMPKRKYTKLDKVDYWGQGDIKNLDGDVATCQKACDDTEGCQGFALRNKHCWLKNNKLEAPIYSSKIDHYYTDKAPPITKAEAYSIIRRTDYMPTKEAIAKGVPGTYKAVKTPLSSCQAECNKNKDCIGFSNIGDNCWLKDQNQDTQVSNNQVTFYYKGPIPLPKGSGRYVILEKPTGKCLNIAEIQVFSTDGKTDIALKKTVTQSSFYDTNQFPASFLVDGNLNNFAHTSCKEDAWMQIDLGADYPITKVIVHNRVDCCRDRIHGANIRILDSNKKTTFVSDPIDIKNPVGNLAYVIKPPNKTINYYNTRDFLSSNKPSYNWGCVSGIDVPVSLNENGDVQCMATDGVNCLWGQCQEKLKNQPQSIKPLTCGDVHKKIYGGTGYDTPDHWCSKARPELKGKVKTWAQCASSDECADTTAYCHKGDRRCLTDAQCNWANGVDFTTRDCSRLPRTVVDGPNCTLDNFDKVPGGERKVSPECYQKIWKDAGCTTTSWLDDWRRNATKDELIRDSKLWATMTDTAHKKGCYGDASAVANSNILGRIVVDQAPQ